MGPSGRRVARKVLDFFFHIYRTTLHLLFSLLYQGPGEKVPPIGNLILLDSASILAHKIRNKILTSVEVVESFIKRIKETNGILNAVIDHRFDDALEEAKRADDLVQNSGKTPEQLAEELPFLGVPFTAKEAVSIKGLSSTAGLCCRKGETAEQDADAVNLLRKAGGIPIAATNLPEVCLWWECYNNVYGRTSNPYNVNRTSGGSSGGEAANIAAAGSPMGLGSDIAGSLRMPANFNGIFAHKPSSGVVSTKGHFPLPKPDFLKVHVTIGPMSRFATDLLPILKTVTIPSRRNVLNLDQKVDVTKLKHYYAEDDGGGIFLSPVDTEIKQNVRKIVAYLKKTHGITAEKVEFPVLKQSLAVLMGMMKAPGEGQIQYDLADHKGKVNPFVELLKLPFGLSKNTLPALTVALAERFSFAYDSPIHRHFTSKAKQFKADFESLLGSNGVFIYPTHPTAAQFHNEAFANPMNFAYGALFSVTGLPATHCPIGLNRDGMPIGIQVVAPQYQDRLTIAVAEELEKAFGGWVPPTVTI